jgi:hypothetical protein
VLLGVLVGLALAEGLFWYRHGGAFPHLNVYLADKELGARLRPLGETRVSFAGNPATDVRINSSGYRGSDFPPPGSEEVLVVGDSQVFGLGVEESETFSAQLGALLGPSVTVINGGVPTYGPAEYNAVIAEVGRARKPKTVVMVINMANDLFEAKRPNRERHTIWDGWAVRAETAPQQTSSFPGRDLLFNRSHAVFELRRWLHRRSAVVDIVERSALPSEGHWQDMVNAGAAANTAKSDAQKRTEQHQKEFITRQEALAAQTRAADDKVIADLVALETNPERQFVPVNYQGEQGYIGLETRLRAARANPGDIVGEIGYGESSAPYQVTAATIRAGATYRRYLEEVARKRLAQAEDLKARRTVASLAELQALEQQLEDLLAEAPRREVTWSPLREELERAKALCAEWGARLVVVALPLDVQVSKDEWAKYGQAVQPMEETLVLNRDVLRTSEALGAVAVDALPALAAAEPGAFLKGDLHMTPKGHRALAEALAASLKAPKPMAKPLGGLPKGRTRAPSPSAFAVEVDVAGSSAAKCATYLRSHWFRLVCRAHGEDQPLNVVLSKGGHGEVLMQRADGELSLLFPFLAGDTVEGFIVWQKHRRALALSWPENAELPEMRIGKEEALPTDSTLVPAPEPAAELCRCAESVRQQAAAAAPPRQEIQGLAVPQFRCVEAVFAPNAACARTYADDCKAMLACANGDPWFAPTCDSGFANGGALERCLEQCDETTPCPTGKECRPWQGAGLCF